MPTATPITIGLLGTPVLWKGRSRIAPGQLLLRLAAAHPQPVRRDDLVATLYPDQPTAEARNRLRVGLTRLRRSVPLLEAGDRVGLDPGQVRVDLDGLRARLSAIRLEPSAETEAEALRELLPQLGEVLFPGAASAWELEAQAAWSQTAAAALERLGEFAEQAVDPTLAAAVAEASLRHFPDEAAAWERYLRAMTRLGRAAEAARRLAAARRQARAEGWSFPENLDGWHPPSDDRETLGPELTAGESQTLERCFRRALAAQPELVVEILGSPSFRPEVIRSPRTVLPMLREALALATPPSEARERIAVRMITALGAAEDHRAVLEAVASFLEQPVAPARRRIALLNASFAHAMVGDLAAAMEAVDAAMALASGPTAEYDVHECRAQRATFLMFAGDLVAAEAETRAALAYLDSRALEGTEPDRLAIRGNLGLNLVHQRRYREAVDILRPVVESARARNLPVNLALSAPPLGLALAHVGAEVETLPTDGLRAAFRMGERRAITAAAYVGRTLRALGRDPGEEILREALGFRQAAGPALNALERDLFEPILDQPAIPSRPLVEFVRATMRAGARPGDAG